MAMLDVAPENLKALARMCSVLATEVAWTSRPVTGSSASGQATVAAVHILHAGVSTAGQAVAARFESTGEKLAAGGAAFLSHDDAAAADLTMVESSGE